MTSQNCLFFLNLYKFSNIDSRYEPSSNIKTFDVLTSFCFSLTAMVSTEGDLLITNSLLTGDSHLERQKHKINSDLNHNEA